MRLSTADSREDESAVDKFVKRTDCTVAGESFGAIPFQGSSSSVHVVRESTAVHAFTTEVPRARRLVYTSRFFLQSLGLKTRKKLQSKQ